MKKFQKISIILIGFAIIPSILCIGALNGNNVSENSNFNSNHLNISEEPFLLLQEFGASTYYISPEASPGSNDEVFFSFMTNKDGNFSISVNNYPSELTSTIELEDDVAFDNPSGTNLWYLSYLELDIEFEGLTINRIGNYSIKLLISDDKGGTWERKTIAEFIPSGMNFAELFRDLAGLGLSAYPEMGLIGAVSWYNYSDLVFVGSLDNGTTWGTPKTIIKAGDIGADFFFNPFQGFYPLLEICILKNSSIYVLTQANSPSYTPIVYFRSDDNGITWSIPKNVTVSRGDNLRKIKMQVDYETGDFWFMWMYTNDTIDYQIEWSEFNRLNNETLYSNVPVNIIYNGKDCNFDFLYDGQGSIFRMIRVHPIGSYPFENFEVFNFTCTSFGSSWDNTSLGYHDVLDNHYASVFTLNFAFDGNEFQLFYEASYTGFTELYQYYVRKNPIFWEINGFFIKDEPIQIHWNGRKYITEQITISTVRVEFTAQNNTDTISRTKYITIDNDTPYYEEYIQKKHYFNPLSGDITFTEVEWDLLASEECTAFLEIFKQGSSLSDWQKVTNNNLHELDPKIFRSNTGELYILYHSVELGTKIVYLIKSHDNGITWSSPVEITRITSKSSDFRYEGAAWGPVVIIYLRDVDSGEDLFYRSFVGGEFFEPPIPMMNLVINDKVEKLKISNNGTLFLLYRNYPALYTVLKSADLGFNWDVSAQWTDYPPNFTAVYDLKADMAYDYENDLLHVVLPYLNYTRVANYSVATLDVSTSTWREPRGTGTIYPMGTYSREPKLLITRDSDPPFIKLKILYIHDQQTMGTWTNYTLKEIVSNDLGATWSGPYLVENSNNATIFTSSIFDTFYVTQKSDGNDYEVYFSREGSLIRTKKETLSSASHTDISFDGIDDFGAYISEGNYSYNLHLRDDAGNFINTQGWFFADYNAPEISEPIVNWTFTPTPRLDVEVTADITDGIGFSAFIYYKRDLGTWITIPMENIGGDTYLAVIPHDNTTNMIQYYIKAVDLAGNAFYRDRGSLYYTYDMPRYEWESLGLFNETTSYSSSQNYEISITITTDLEYVQSLIFRYSYDGGTTWYELELLPNSPEFIGILEDIPEDTQILMYELLLNDIFGEQVTLYETQQISFFPEIPSFTITGPQSIIVITIAAVVGFLVAFGYIKLKSKSHEVIYKQIFLREYAKKSVKIEKNADTPKKKHIKIGKKKGVSDEKGVLLEKSVGASPFTIAYLGILSITLAVFFLGYNFAEVNPQGGVLLLAASLVLSIFGYMILISRDISLNIYLEKIFKRNIMLEFFQIGFMLLNIIIILFKGYEIAWFRYYLIEQTYDLGTVSIPKLYISVFGVFFTSLVLVMITTYLQLRKTVKNVQAQRSQGASDNLLLYIKDQNSSRLITQMGYKTIAFMVTVLIGIVSTTNLLTAETGMALLVVIIPFIIAGFSALIVHRIMERKSQKEKIEDIELPFIDSRKECNNCGKSIYLSNKYCGSCGNQVIYAENVGIYTSKCPICDGYIYEEAEFCPTCGTEVKKQA
ncbi:MAG: zinc ribbon domain-containing protein [Candidatus Hodarchaeota archaeon]